MIEEGEILHDGAGCANRQRLLVEDGKEGVSVRFAHQQFATPLRGLLQGVQEVIVTNLLGGKAGNRLGVADMARKELQDQHNCRNPLLPIDNSKRCASTDLERVLRFVDEGSDEVTGAGVVGSDG